MLWLLHSFTLDLRAKKLPHDQAHGENVAHQIQGQSPHLCLCITQK